MNRTEAYILIVGAVLILAAVWHVRKGNKDDIIATVSDAGDQAFAATTGKYNVPDMFNNAPINYILHGTTTVQGLTGLDPSEIKEIFDAVQ